MAEGILLAIVTGLVANVASEAFKKIRLPLGLFGVKDELCRLGDTLQAIQAVLCDAEEKAETSAQVKVWLDRLEDVVYDADNLFDKCDYQEKLRQVRTLSLGQLFKLKMARKIKRITKTLEDIKSDNIFSTLIRFDHGTTSVPSTIMLERETYSYITNNVVIGRDDEKKKITRLLLDNNIHTRGSVSVISIVGVGGLGKTTLAKFVFNDKEVKNHFGKQMWWVYVSDVFNLKLLVQKIIRSVTGKSPDQNLDLEQLHKQLAQEIQGKRYLLVLDDVWNEDRNEWDKLVEFLNVNATSSVVLITTRSMKIARIVNSTKTHELSALDEGQSWALFKKINYEGTNLNLPPEETMKDIVGKCKGVPLAIKTIGRLIMHERIDFVGTEFVEVVHNQNETDFMPTLKLSYNHLESNLRRCFAYCSLFPKDHRIDVQHLIQLWIAHGFVIRPDNNNSQLEDIGYKYFEKLLFWFFFEDDEEDEMLKTVKYCKMHGLMHDLASSVAGKSIQLLDSTKIDRQIHSFQKARHIYVDFKSNSSCQISKIVFNQKKLRTFILPKIEILGSSKYDNFLSKFKSLRALSLRTETNMESLPSRLGKLKHLRYLDLSGNEGIKELPNSITDLYNLQTLILTFCKSLVRLPTAIQNLISLRHLKIDGCSSLTHMPRGIGKLVSLQTLDTFVMAHTKASKSAGFGELGKLKNLHGHISIQVSSESGTAQCLEDLNCLKSLLLDWSNSQGTRGNDNEAFKPHQNIKAIKLFKYPSEALPNWLSSLSKLVRLKIDSCDKCKYLPPLHHFSFLQELWLHSLSALEYVSEGDNDSSTPFFPSLVTLKVIECVDLKGWWGGERRDEQPYFPELSELVIDQCPLLTSMPLFPNVKHLHLLHTSSKSFQETMKMKLKGNADHSIVAETPSSTSASSFPLSKLKDLKIVQVLQTSSKSLQETMKMKMKGNADHSSVAETSSSTSASSFPLSKLKDLFIHEVGDLESLPSALHTLSSLQALSIQDCSNLVSLPEGRSNLKSLQKLDIYRCSKLTSIPKWICSLPSLEYVNNERWPQTPPVKASADDRLWKTIMSKYFSEFSNR